MKPSGVSGIIPPLITPLTDQQCLDREGLFRIIDHVITGGVHGVFLLGTTGEFASLEREIQEEVIIHGIQAVSGRVPVFINISSPAYRESLRLARRAKQAGADYLVLAPPYYYGTGPGETFRFYTRMAEETQLPVLIYNAPQYTHTQIDPHTVHALSENGNISGIKDSSGDPEYLRELVRLRGNSVFPILVGPEPLLGPALSMGCDGGVCGGANIYPRLYVDYFMAATSGKHEAMEELGMWIDRMNREVYQTSGSPVRIILGIKSMMELKGFCTARTASPYDEPISTTQQQILQDYDRELSSIGY